MNTLKRVQLAVLFLVAAAAVLSAGAPAVAKNPHGPSDTLSWEVALTPTDAQSRASGQATVEDYVLEDDGWAYMTVSCKGLTPGATYYVRVSIAGYTSDPLDFPLTATTRQRWQGERLIPYLWWGRPGVVDVVNDTGDVVLTGEL